MASDFEVGEVRHGGATHRLREPWSYTGANTTKCGIHARSVIRYHSGAPVDITCGNCVDTSRPTVSLVKPGVPAKGYTPSQHMLLFREWVQWRIQRLRGNSLTVFHNTLKFPSGHFRPHY